MVLVHASFKWTMLITVLAGILRIWPTLIVIFFITVVTFILAWRCSRLIKSLGGAGGHKGNDAQNNDQHRGSQNEHSFLANKGNKGRARGLRSRFTSLS